MSELRDVTIGVDVGGTTTRIVAFARSDRSVVASAVRPTSIGADALVDQISSEIATIATQAGPPRHVGIGIPGRVVDSTAVSMALNVGVLDPFDLGRAVAERVGVPVAVENDVNTGALGAWAHLDQAGPRRSLAYLGIGTGFAAGLVVDGRLVRGATGTAGEIGHLPIPGDATPCACGQTGCAEAIVSGRALARIATRLGVGDDAISLWDAADAGLDGAVEARVRAIEIVAWVCQLAVAMLDVDRIVLGGGVSGLGNRLIDPLVERLGRAEAASPFVAALGPARRLTVAPPGVELGALGADLAAHDRFRTPR